MLDKQKRTTLVWSSDAIEAFDMIRIEIGNCPSLYFVDDTQPIHLQTDASDYGIGCYLYQIINGVERPVQFMSKTLVKEQLG